MSLQIVNGYVCLDCSDVSLAQKGLNPAFPPDSPSAIAKGQPDGVKGGDAAGQSGAPQGSPAVVFGGALSQLQGAAAVQPPAGMSGIAPASSPYDPPVGMAVDLAV